MKRELKQYIGSTCLGKCGRKIAEPIPMKRELKPVILKTSIILINSYCRAYPDEKGIETIVPFMLSILNHSLQSLSR